MRRIFFEHCRYGKRACSAVAIYQAVINGDKRNNINKNQCKINGRSENKLAYVKRRYVNRWHRK